MGTFASRRKGQNFLKARCARFGVGTRLRLPPPFRHALRQRRQHAAAVLAEPSTQLLFFKAGAAAALRARQLLRPQQQRRRRPRRAAATAPTHGLQRARFHKRTSQELSPLDSNKNVIHLFKTHKSKEKLPQIQKNRLRRRLKPGLSIAVPPSTSEISLFYSRYANRCVFGLLLRAYTPVLRKKRVRRYSALVLS